MKKKKLSATTITLLLGICLKTVRLVVFYKKISVFAVVADEISNLQTKSQSPPNPSPNPKYQMIGHFHVHWD